MPPVKTLLADDHRIFVEGLKTVLRKDPQRDYQFSGVAANGADLLRLIQQQPVDLLLIDLQLPGANILETLRRVRDDFASLRILAFVAPRATPQAARAALKAGANGYFLKNRRAEELFCAIDTILNGHPYLGEGIKQVKTPSAPGSAPLEDGAATLDDALLWKNKLTKRELEILQLIAQALSNKEIGKALFISDQTVSVHRKNIMRKLGVSNTAGLLKIVYDHSLV